MSEIPANMTTIAEQLKIYRTWQQKHPLWQLVCDIPDTKSLYIQWSELPQKERDSWVEMYGRDAEGAFEEFATKKCKVKNGVLCPDLKIRSALGMKDFSSLAIDCSAI